jgi:competence protein ComEC
VAPAVIVLFYAGLFALTAVTGRPPEQRPKWWARFASESLPTSGLAGLGLAASLAWSAFFSLPDTPGRLSVTVLDVGMGDGVLIQTPAGARVLIDGGPSEGALVRGLARHMPLFENHIDVLVVAGAQDENVGGLADLLTRYSVERAVLTQASSKSTAYRALIEALNGAQVEKVLAADLPILDLGDGVGLRVLNDDAHGTTLRVEWQAFAALIPVGLDADGEAGLLTQTPVAPVTALVVGGHGSDAATSEAWLAALDPRVALISVGAGNAAGAPSPAILSRLAGRNVLRTDEHGALTLSTDGRQLWVEAQR